MSGGGNNKSGPNPPSHFKIWRYTPQRRKQVRRGKEQFAPFSFFSEVPTLKMKYLFIPVNIWNNGVNLILIPYPQSLKNQRIHLV